jgi:ABC-type Fe3+/spermidine/putrescine transport system ATPase subunit
VATFIGTANQFNGKASGNSRVLCERYELETKAFDRIGDGEKVVVLVRPEAIQVQTDPMEKTSRNAIQGTVETVTFHGAITRLGVNVFGQRVVADISEANTKPISLNQKVWLTFPAEACQVMVHPE